MATYIGARICLFVQMDEAIDRMLLVVKGHNATTEHGPVDRSHAPRGHAGPTLRVQDDGERHEMDSHAEREERSGATRLSRASALLQVRRKRRATHRLQKAPATAITWR